MKRVLSAAFEALGYTVQRKQPPHWVEDASLAQERLLEGSPVGIVLDVGAHTGDTVERYRAMFPGATIHAFEPFPDAHRRLSDRFAADRSIRPHQAAVADVSGTRRLFVNDDSHTNSLLPLDRTADWGLGIGTYGQAVDVRAVTLDEFCAAERIDRIDLLKLDIQGGEGMALDGAAGLLARQAVRVIYLEVAFARLYVGQAFFCDVTHTLNRHGYRVFGLYNLVQANDGLLWADAIFWPS